jgi:transcriptional antiterminator RfaH
MAHESQHLRATDGGTRMMAVPGPKSEKGGSWYLAQYKPRNLERAELNLKRQGFSTFCPKQRITLQVGKSVNEQVKPLFPNYLFIQSGPDSVNWRVINSTFGVSHLVGRTPTRPSMVSEQIIAEFKARCDENAVLVPSKGTDEGKPVQSSSSAFAQFFTRIDSMPDDRRAFALIEFLGL